MFSGKYIFIDAIDYDLDLTDIEINKILAEGLTSKSTAVQMAATTRRKRIQQRSDWNMFKAAEKKQLDKHFAHQVFGGPISRQQLPPGEKVCHQLWNYYIKRCGTYKARDFLNGKQLTKMGTLYKNTFNVCVNWMPCTLIFFALSAALNHIIVLHDVVNAFMESDAPSDDLYVVVDQPMSDYYQDVLKKKFTRACVFQF